MQIQSGTPFYVSQGNAFNLNAPGSGQVPDQIKPTVALNSNWTPCPAAPCAVTYFGYLRLRAGEYPE